MDEFVANCPPTLPVTMADGEASFQVPVPDPANYSEFHVSREQRDTWHQQFLARVAGGTANGAAGSGPAADVAPTVRYTPEQLSPRDRERLKFWEEATRQAVRRSWCSEVDEMLTSIGLPVTDRGAPYARATMRVHAVIDITREFERAGNMDAYLEVFRGSDQRRQLTYLRDCLDSDPGALGVTVDVQAEGSRQERIHPFLDSAGGARLDPVTHVAADTADTA
jgi:hypothetical protein